MKYCSKCGTESLDDAAFCTKCGTKFVLENENVQVSEIQEGRSQAGKPDRKKVITIAIAAASVICLVILGVVLANLFGGKDKSEKPIGFDVEYSEEDISRFLTKVCKNIKGTAKVSNPAADVPAAMYGDYIVPMVEIKRKGMIAEEVGLAFSNTDPYDAVTKVEMTLDVSLDNSWYQEDENTFVYREDNHFLCQKELLIAMEETIAGKAYVDDYITTDLDLHDKVYDCEPGEKVVLATYALTDDVMVIIEMCNETGFDATQMVYYTLCLKDYL